MMTPTDSVVIPPEAHRSNPTGPSHRLDYIDALRCFACLWVILTHSFNATKVSGHVNPILSVAYGFASLGWLGVHLFLVLSGFCLYFPVVRRGGVAGASVNVKEFALRRARRILPPYYIALAIFIVWNLLPSVRHADPPPAGVFGFHDIVLHVLMLHNFTSESFQSINGAFWSLALESQLYVIFPLLVMLARRFGLRSILAVTMAVSLAWQTGSLWWLRHAVVGGVETGPAGLLFCALPGRCFEFAAGMCAAALVANPRPVYVRAAAAAAIIIAVPDTWWLLHHSRYGLFIDQGWGVVFASLAVAASFLPLRWFQSGVLAGMTWIGMFSYSLYLIHLPLLNYFRPARFGLHLQGMSLIAFNGARILPLVALAYGFFLVAEKPFLTRKKRPGTATLEREAALSPAP